MNNTTILLRLGSLAAALALVGFAAGCNSQDAQSTDNSAPPARSAAPAGAQPASAPQSGAPATTGQPAPPPGPKTVSGQTAPAAPDAPRSMEEQHRDKAGT